MSCRPDAGAPPAFLLRMPRWRGGVEPAVLEPCVLHTRPPALQCAPPGSELGPSLCLSLLAAQGPVKTPKQPLSGPSQVHHNSKDPDVGGDVGGERCAPQTSLHLIPCA